MKENIPSVKLMGNVVYYNEIIHPTVFKELYINEKPICNFKSKVILGDRPFVTFLKRDRKNMFTENDVLLMRMIKGNKQVQFISKMYKWGRISIPKGLTKVIKIKNHEEVSFIVINRSQELQTINNKRIIDLVGIGSRIIPRNKKYITLCIKEKIPITLPRFIKVNSQLLELFYLIHGDGHYQYKLYFVNKAYELHRFVLKEFENIFKFPKELWKARILISNFKFGSYAKAYWKKKLDLTERQFYNISDSTLNTSETGNLRIIIDKTIVSTIFRFVFDRLKALNNQSSLHALNGLLYAEGGAQISGESLHKITLSFNKKEKSMFKNILDNLHLKYKIEQNRNFIIQGWNNQYLFFKAFLSKGVVPFEKHNERRSRAVFGFLRHSFTKTMLKYLSVLIKKENLTVREFSELLNIRKDSLLDTLRKKQYTSFVKLTGKGSRNSPFMISIKQEGIYFIKMVEKLREEAKLPFEQNEREVLVKRLSSTSEKFGCVPEKRSVEDLLNYGVVNINKPQGPTSHQVADYVKRILNVPKAGHSGTLEN